jgi:hypothetical protein
MLEKKQKKNKEKKQNLATEFLYLPQHHSNNSGCIYIALQTIALPVVDVATDWLWEV